jgi:rubrerythrin
LETTLEVLHVALDFEKNGMEFYREAAGRVQDKVVKSVLLSLADDEEAHQNIIRRYYHAIEAKRWIPEAADEELPPSKSAAERIRALVSEVISPVGPDATYASIYETAVQFETKSYDYYMSQQSDNPRVNAFFKYLAGVERIHREMLQLMLEPK